MINYIVAKVNDEIITRRDLEEALSRHPGDTVTDESPILRANAKSARRILSAFDAIASGGGIDKGQLPAMRRTLREMVDRTLLRQVAGRQLGVSRLESIRAAVDRYYLRNRRGAQPGDAEVTSGTVDAEMDRRIFEALLRKNVSIDRDAIAPSAVRAYYDDHLDAFHVAAKVTFRHLFLRSDEAMIRREAGTRAEALRGELLAGADFDLLARQHSDGPHATEGGHWMEVDPSTWRSELTGCLIESPVGRVSDIVESEIGLHIVQVLERNGFRIRSFDEVQASIKDHLYWRLADDAIGSWLAKIAQEAYVWSLFELHGATLHDN